MLAKHGVSVHDRSGMIQNRNPNCRAVEDRAELCFGQGKGFLGMFARELSA